MTNDRATLMKEIDRLPDAVVKELANIVHYLALGVESEFVPQTDNPFYRSAEFAGKLADAVREHKAGKTEDMDL